MLHAQMLDQLQAVRAGQRNVDHRQVRRRLAQGLERLRQGARLTAQLQVGLRLDEAGESVPEDGMIVDEEDAALGNGRFLNHCCHGWEWLGFASCGTNVLSARYGKMSL